MMMETGKLLARVLALPSVPFTARTQRLPNLPGIYFAIRDDGELLYIGMSRKSIRQRWKTWHIAVNNATKEGIEDRVRIAFVLYRDIGRLVEDEKAAIREFRPLWNAMGVSGYLERQQRMDAETCKWIDCDEHRHDKWPPLAPPTETRSCRCIVHRSCGERYGREFAETRAAV